LRGGIVKVITAYSQRKEELSVAVVDSGIGVTYENVPNLFNPFSNIEEKHQLN
jgi:phosphoglycerate-specific signal transduction histidine kinase